MLKLRLQRRGKKNYSTYRVVVAEQSAPIKGKFIADVGHYNPHKNEFNVDNEQVTRWLSNGVQPSNTVHNLLINFGIIKGDKKVIWQPGKKKKSELGQEEATDKSNDTKNEEKSQDNGNLVKDSADNNSQPKEDSVEESAKKEPSQDAGSSAEKK
jgi:small subunit ribosomal protein S16